MHLLLLLMILIQAQATDLRSLAETTFTRDNTYCQINQKRVEIQLRGHSRLTEARDRKYGELLLFYPSPDKPELLPLNQDKLHTYRFFTGSKSQCSKSLGFLIGKERLAVLFLVENRPFKDKLAIQYFDAKTGKALNAIETDYQVDEAEATEDGFAFRVVTDLGPLEMGKLTISEKTFTYQNRDLGLWIKHTPEGLEYSAALSFQKSEWKKFFQDETDFLTALGWDEKNKKFATSKLYLAVNHKEKRECIYLGQENIKTITSEQGLRCR